MKKTLFILVFCLVIQPFLTRADSIVDFTSPLSQPTFVHLKDRFGVELVQENISQPWTDFEGQSILKLLESLPTDLGFVIKDHWPRNLQMMKIIKPVPVSLKDLKKSYSSKKTIVPVYRHGDIQSLDISKSSAFSSRQKEMVSQLLSHHLIVANMDDLVGSNTAEIIDKRLKHYLLYLNREVLTYLLYIYDEVFEKSNDKEWQSFSRLENHDVRGYAHPRGMSGAAEDFIHFGASFFSPPITLYNQSIKCRTPQKYAFFKTLFPGHQPYLENPEFARRNIKCPDIDSGFLSGLEFKDIYTGRSIEMGPVNGKSISEIELIYATPGDREISEIAGHLLLRIKLDNNPEAKRLGIENPYDVTVALLADNDRFITAGGDRKTAITESDREVCPSQKETAPDFSEIVGGSIQALKGLSGQYRTIFQIDTLQWAVDHYTIKNNRTLERFRLNLTEKQKERFLEYLYISKNSFKTDYYFFTRNCGSVLVKLIGEALRDEDIATYNTLASPPNALITLLLEKNLISPVYPHFYSYTARAQIAQDIIADQMEKLRDLDPNEVWPSDDLLFHKDDETRVIAYERLYPIAMKAPETRTGILNVLNMAQKAELVFTWNKGECVEYSTKTKGEVRKNLKRLYQTIENAPIVDLDQEITSWDSDQEELDNLEGSSHTRLMSWRLGAGAVKSPAKDWRALFTLGGAIYGQDMGDLSNRAMQRGTSVMLGDVDLSFKRVNEGHVEITDWRITGLKIRKIKARRHYIPSVFSRNRKLGLGFTLLELSTDPWEENRYKTVFAEGEVFTSLVSSRLNLDHLNIALGVGLETPWGTENCFAAMLLNEETLLEIPFRLDGLLTFGDNRQLQTRAMLEYKYFYDFKGDDSASYSKKNLLVGTSFVYRLAEINKAEVLLKGNLEFKDDFSQDATGNRNQQLMLRVGFEINRW